MKTVIVKPNLTFNSGNARMVLTQIGAGTITDCFDGSLLCELTDEQIRLFRLKGSMHQITVNQRSTKRLSALQPFKRKNKWLNGKKLRVALRRKSSPRPSTNSVQIGRRR